MSSDTPAQASDDPCPCHFHHEAKRLVESNDWAAIRFAALREAAQAVVERLEQEGLDAGMPEVATLARVLAKEADREQ